MSWDYKPKKQAGPLTKLKVCHLCFNEFLSYRWEEAGGLTTTGSGGEEWCAACLWSSDPSWDQEGGRQNHSSRVCFQRLRGCLLFGWGWLRSQEEHPDLKECPNWWKCDHPQMVHATEDHHIDVIGMCSFWRRFGRVMRGMFVSTHFELVSAVACTKWAEKCGKECKQPNKKWKHTIAKKRGTRSKGSSSNTIMKSNEMFAFSQGTA